MCHTLERRTMTTTDHPAAARPTARARRPTRPRAADERATLGGSDGDDPLVAHLVREVVALHPSVGLAVAVIRDGRVASFASHGLRGMADRAPVTPDTGFRIGSITKLFTAIAILQVWEEGRLDLDAPAPESLRAFRIVPAASGIGLPTIRHLLTHTSGIPEVRHLADLLHPDWGPWASRPAEWSVRAGERLPSLAEVYRDGLRVVVEPGSAFAYSNHGFATLGQIVEDVSGMPLARYLRERVFEPLGMDRTELERTHRVTEGLATGYVLGATGPRPVPDRDWVCLGAGGAYSTARDLARFATALLGGGSNAQGSILRPATLAMMLQPDYQPDARLPGMGLAFFRHDLGGQRAVGHDGILPGFQSALLVAPDAGTAVVGLTNGSHAAMTWLPRELDRLLRRIVGVPEDAVRHDIPQRPDTWPELCGRYRLPPRISDVRQILATGGGVEVAVRGGRLMARLRTPVPGLSAWHPLHPDDAVDPAVHRVDLSRFGMGTIRLAFARHASGHGGMTHLHADLQAISLERAPEPGAVMRWTRRVFGGARIATAQSTTGRTRHARVLDRRRAVGAGGIANPAATRDPR
jgi:CubicO group peptidase (beta-lactamase class C family)